MSSAIFEHAAREWQRMRYDYERHIEQAYNTALNATGGVLVNKAGRQQGIDGLELFTGTAARAYKYASEELIEYWETHPRITLAQYEAQWLQGNERYAYV